MGHQTLISNIFEILYTSLICLYLGSLMLYKKVFVLLMELWFPPSSMFVDRKIKQKLTNLVSFFTYYFNLHSIHLPNFHAKGCPIKNV